VGKRSASMESYPFISSPLSPYLLFLSSLSLSSLSSLFPLPLCAFLELGVLSPRSSYRKSGERCEFSSVSGWTVETGRQTLSVMALLQMVSGNQITTFYKNQGSCRWSWSFSVLIKQKN